LTGPAAEDEAARLCFVLTFEERKMLLVVSHLQRRDRNAGVGVAKARHERVERAAQRRARGQDREQLGGQLLGGGQARVPVLGREARH
jgi:hypothetical protein